MKSGWSVGVANDGVMQQPWAKTRTMARRTGHLHRSAAGGDEVDKGGPPSAVLAVGEAVGHGDDSGAAVAELAATDLGGGEENCER